MALSIPFSLLRTITRNSLHFLKLQTHISHNLGGTNSFKFEILIGYFIVNIFLYFYVLHYGNLLMETNFYGQIEEHFNIYFNKFSLLISVLEVTNPLSLQT